MPNISRKAVKGQLPAAQAWPVTVDLSVTPVTAMSRRPDMDDRWQRIRAPHCLTNERGPLQMAPLGEWSGQAEWCASRD